MTDVSRLVIQDWRPAAERARVWPEEEQRVRALLQEIPGMAVLSLKPGSGVLEFDTEVTGPKAKVKRAIERRLTPWKVYDWTIYGLPSG